VRGKDPSKLLRLIIENIDLLIAGWYSNYPKILIPLPPNKLTYKTISKPEVILTLEEVEVAAAHGKTVIEYDKDESIKIESIAPDLVLADFADILIDFKDLEIIKVIGEGGFGRVYTAEYKKRVVAVKQVMVEDHLKVEVFREFRHEVALMWYAYLYILLFLIDLCNCVLTASISELKQPNIVQLLGVCLDPWCLVLEYLQYGDLFSFLANLENKINWQMRLKMAQNIAEAIRFLHRFQPKIIHRDLKSPNCLVC
jgi:serine/threonine protein kinase